jgi:hypothetical protein
MRKLLPSFDGRIAGSQPIVSAHGNVREQGYPPCSCIMESAT